MNIRVGDQIMAGTEFSPNPDWRAAKEAIYRVQSVAQDGFIISGLFEARSIHSVFGHNSIFISNHDLNARFYKVTLQLEEIL